jgi:hypothetical protein
VAPPTDQYLAGFQPFESMINTRWPETTTWSIFALIPGIGIARSCGTVGPSGREASRSSTTADCNSARRPTRATASFAAQEAPTRLPPA